MVNWLGSVRNLTQEKVPQAPLPISPGLDDLIGTDNLGADILTWNTDFVWEQQADPPFICAFDQLSVDNGESLEQQLLNQWPHFKFQGEQIYHIKRDKQMCKVRSQLLVPAIYRQEMMRLAHEILCSGHLGREETLD